MESLTFEDFKFGFGDEAGLGSGMVGWMDGWKEMGKQKSWRKD